MPVISGADLTNVSTTYQPLPAGSYKTRLKATVEEEPKLRVIVRHKVVESPDGENIGREFTDFIYLMQNDGKPNEIGRKQLKRYFEAVVGKEAANTPNPNTDDLEDAEVMVELEQESYTPKATEGQPNPETKINNRVKRVLAA